MPIADYPWAESLRGLDLPTFTGLMYIEETHRGDIRWIQIAAGISYGFALESEAVGDIETFYQDFIPEHFLLDLDHDPTYAMMCVVLADLMGFEGASAEVSNQSPLSNYPQVWTVAVLRGEIGVTLHHLHHTEGLETREEALAFALSLYQDGDPAEGLIDSVYEEDQTVDRMALLMEE